MRQSRCLIGLGFVDDDGDFYFGSRDQLNINSAAAETVEEFRSHAGVRTHSDADDAQLGDAAFGDQLRCFKFGNDRRE